MKKKHKVVYTIRDISQESDLRVREIATAEGVSLNSAILHLIDRGLGLAKTPVRRRNLQDLLAHSDPIHRKEWDRALAEMDRVDEELWK